MQIKPIKDLRNTTAISEACHASNEPIFITKNGYGDLVVMSMETYNDLLRVMSEDRAITDSEMEFERSGELFELEETLAELKVKRHG